jgi:hypothetical protein
MWPVSAMQFLKTRVSPDIKHRVQQAANRQLITESVWLKRLVIQALSNSAESNLDEVEAQAVSSRAALGIRAST